MPLNVKIMCRLCMGHKGVLLFSIFDNKAEKIEKYPDTLPVRISKCLALEVSFNDPLPNYICQRCLYYINRFYKFREKAVESCFRINKIIEALTPVQDASNEEELQDKPYQEKPIIVVNCNAHAQEEVDPLALPIDCDASASKSQFSKHSGDDNTSKLIPVILKNENPESTTTLLANSHKNENLVSTTTLLGNSHTPNVGIFRTKRTYAPFDLKNIPSNTIDPLPSTSSYFVYNKATLVDPNLVNDASLKTVHLMKKADPTVERIHNIDNGVMAKTNIQEIQKYTGSTASSGSDGVIQSLYVKPAKNPTTKGKQNKYKCPLCFKLYTSKECFIQHRKLHSSPLQCDTCDRSFLNKSALMKHKNLIHANPEIALFNCKHCEKGFTDNDCLVKHVNTVHPVIEHLQKSARSKFTVFKCMQCSEVFSDTMSLDKHVRNHKDVRMHPSTRLCPLLQFKNTATLKGNTSTIHNMANFVCKLCSNNFLNKDCLDNHVRTTHINSLFTCEVCLEYFISKSDFEVHKLQHIKRPRISCKFCSKTFVTRNEVYCHLKTCHTSKIMPCMSCPEIFTDESEYDKHELEHVKVIEQVSEYSQCESCGGMFLGMNNLTIHKATCSKVSIVID